MGKSAGSDNAASDDAENHSRSGSRRSALYIWQFGSAFRVLLRLPRCPLRFCWRHSNTGPPRRYPQIIRSKPSPVPLCRRTMGRKRGVNKKDVCTSGVSRETPHNYGGITYCFHAILWTVSILDPVRSRSNRSPKCRHTSLMIHLWLQRYHRGRAGPLRITLTQGDSGVDRRLDIMHPSHNRLE